MQKKTWVGLNKSQTKHTEMRHLFSGLEMATDTVANVTKSVWLATRSFQAVAKLASSSILTM